MCRGSTVVIQVGKKSASGGVSEVRQDLGIIPPNLCGDFEGGISKCSKGVPVDVCEGGCLVPLCGGDL